MFVDRIHDSARTVGHPGESSVKYGGAAAALIAADEQHAEHVIHKASSLQWPGMVGAAARAPYIAGHL